MVAVRRRAGREEAPGPHQVRLSGWPSERDSNWSALLCKSVFAWFLLVVGILVVRRLLFLSGLISLLYEVGYDLFEGVV